MRTEQILTLEQEAQVLAGCDQRADERFLPEDPGCWVGCKVTGQKTRP